MKNFNFTDIFNKRLVHHSIFWTVYLLLFATRLIDGNNPDMQDNTSNILMREALRTITLILAVYLNLGIHIPLFFDKNKYYKFILSNIATIITLSIISVWFIELLNLQGNRQILLPLRMLWTCIPVTMFVSITSLLHFTKEWIKLKDIDINIKTLKNEKLAAELESLKGQINPHFLFNTLNNLYSMSLVKSDDAPDMILKLSNLMSYILYDSRVDYISIKKEIDFSSNYIKLEELRLEEHLNLKVNIECSDENRIIAPLLFMPFIENAFKYTQKDTDMSFVNISIRVTENNPIFLRVENSKDIGILESKDMEHSGVGIKNVSKRLKLIYPDKHSLKIEDSVDTFTIILEINDL